MCNPGCRIILSLESPMKNVKCIWGRPYHKAQHQLARTPMKTQRPVHAPHCTRLLAVYPRVGQAIVPATGEPAERLRGLLRCGHRWWPAALPAELKGGTDPPEAQRESLGASAAGTQEHGNTAPHNPAARPHQSTQQTLLFPKNIHSSSLVHGFYQILNF